MVSTLCLIVGLGYGQNYLQILDLLAKTLNTKKISVNVTLVHWWTMDARAVPSVHHNYTILSFLLVSTSLATIIQIVNY